MKLSISNIAWDKEKDIEVYEMMKKHHFTGLEIAPTRVFESSPYEHLADAEEWVLGLDGFTVPSMQSIWYGRRERLFKSESDRETLYEYTCKAIDFASALKCNNLVFGCPTNRNIEIGEDENEALLFFQKLSDYAIQKGTAIGIEANPAIYHTNYINDTKSALDLVKKVNSKGFLLNLDLGTVIQNREEMTCLEGNVKYINHVHISEPYLSIIVKRDCHNELKRILQNEHYSGYISVEMKKQNDLKIIEDIMKYIEGIFYYDI